MSVALPDHLDPWRAVQVGLSFEGVLLLEQLPRLREVVLADGDGALVEYRLAFGRDEEKRPSISGLVRSRLRLLCQRCLGEVEIAVDAPLKIVLVRTHGAAADLGVDVDSLVVDDDGVCLVDLVEDELLLAIPPVPRHAEGDCQSPDGCEDLGSAQAQAWHDPVACDLVDEEKRSHPFAVLTSLKIDRSS